VANELRERGHNVTFVGSSGPVEARVVPALGYTLHTIAISGLPRKLGVGQLLAVIRALTATFTALRIVRAVRPDVVLAGGGFVAAPVAVAAWLRRTPIVATEADAHLGLANRISARFARALCSAYPLHEFRSKQQVTGRPVDPAFAATDRKEGRQRMGIAADARVLAVVGGSGGATHLSEAVYEAFADDPTAGGEPITVVHVAGFRDFDDFAGRGPTSERYSLLQYCDDMPALFAAADLVISRAGGSVFELAAARRASILVPFPHATGDHQTKNAQHFVERAAAVMVPNAQASAERLQREVDALLAPERDAVRTAMEQEVSLLARPNAAADIADAIEDAVR
jgi:UDP-N-acetylglucosamine--N-acetylmuramyl-(pentapeptide) pyrophosphoryl-undecaprenol N-acetylglucosamine transferase